MITIVSGFGRCGSSLTMQMLAAGGADVVGPWPSYEDPIAELGGALLSGSAEATAALDGKVVKVLDPHLGRLPKADYRAIWCARDVREQARSQVKFMTMIMGIPGGREQIRSFERSYRADEPRALRALRGAGATEMIIVQFERTLLHPYATAEMLASFCNIAAERVPSMATVVRARSARCATGMDMELALIAERDA